MYNIENAKKRSRKSNDYISLGELCHILFVDIFYLRMVFFTIFASILSGHLQVCNYHCNSIVLNEQCGTIIKSRFIRPYAKCTYPHLFDTLPFLQTNISTKLLYLSYIMLHRSIKALHKHCMSMHITIEIKLSYID